jgi:2-polyprenyl-3-methyl-5-hydroxy-6-metoxy-1,4-benzoquinol methylase
MLLEPLLFAGPSGTWSRGSLFPVATDHIASVDNATQIEFRPPIMGTRVGRPWRRRLKDLLACELDYRGKTVLDAGCNVGILAYEIAKLGPSFIHAIDGSQPELDAARLILRSVEIPTRVDFVDLAGDARLRAILEPAYDIVQLLAVYQHVQRVRGDAAAGRMLATLAERCRDTFVVATQPDYLPAIIDALSASGFRLERETQSPARRVKHLVFRRR